MLGAIPTGAPAAGGYWVVGGYSEPAGGKPDPANRRPHNVAALYRASGERLRLVDLPLDDGKFLFHSRVTTVAGRDLLLGVACQLPVNEEGGCSDVGEPVLFQLPQGSGRGAAERVDLPGAVVEGDGSPGSNRIELVGTLGNDLVAMQGSPASTALGGGGVAPTALRIRIPSGEVTRIPLPEGVVTSGSVCTMPSSIVAATPILDEMSYVVGLRLFELANGTGEWRQVAELPIERTQAVGGRLYCLASALIAHLDLGGSSRFFTIDSQRWVLREPVGGTTATGIVSNIDVQANRVVVTVVDGSAVQYWDFDSNGSPELLAQRRRSSDGSTIPAGVVTGRGVVDAGPSTRTPAAQSSEVDAPDEVSQG